MILFSGSERILRDSAGPDYGGMLEGMEAAELLALIEQAQRRLEKMGMGPVSDPALGAGRDAGVGTKREPESRRDASGGLYSAWSLSQIQADEPPVKLFVDSNYNIFLNGPGGERLPFRPLVRAIFILFLRHPEGILLKERDQFRTELEEIYAVIAHNVAAEDRNRRVRRLMDLQCNAFSENTSVLNATLDRILPPEQASECKIQGYNGHPRRIPLSPLMVEWEE